MEYIFPLLLTMLSFYSIIIVLKKIEKRVLKNIRYRQSDIRESIKPFISKQVNKAEKKTQMDKMLEKNSVNVMIIDNQAYWVFNNVFYTANFIDGNVDTESTKPIDTSNMSKKDMDKMFFILDKLGDGKTNDSSSSGS